MSRRLLCLCVCSLALALGCGQTPEPAVDPNEAGKVLQVALESWKKGESYGTLQQRQPPIYFNEREWEAGSKLENFQAGPVDLMGRQGRCKVKLSIRDKAGKVADRDVTYLIDTVPKAVIVREMMGP